MPVGQPRSSRFRCQHSRHNERHAVLAPSALVSHVVVAMLSHAQILRHEHSLDYKWGARYALGDVHWQLMTSCDQRTGAASNVSNPEQV